MLRDKIKHICKMSSFGLAFAFVLMICLTYSDRVNVSAEEEEEDWVHYVGVATGKVNVRTGPGQEYDKVTTADGESVQLQPQEEVVIIGEDVASDTGIVWFEIEFKRGDETIKGFSTSTYLSKDETRMITPSPLPTATPTPSPTPTPSAAPTSPEPTKELLPEDNQPANSKDKLLFIILAVIAVAVIFLILIIVLNIIRSKSGRKKTAVSRKVDKLKKMNIDGGGNNGRKRPEIRRLSDEPPVAEEVRKDVYLKAQYDYSDYTESASGDELKKNATKEADEKKALRAAIERLQEHDIVIHKYFGEGEVYDNSDVKLLEVRFGNDVRFLNKESLVSKKLLEVCDEEEQVVARRRNSRRRSNRNRNE